MNRRFLLFRLFGVPVAAEASVAFLVGIYLLLGGFAPAQLLSTGVFLVAVLVSILWHEFGHALVARRMGCTGIAVVLHGAGGLTYHSAARSLGATLAISLAGPAAGLALGLPLLGLRWTVGGGDLGLVDLLWSDLVYVNVVWSLFNLIPMMPLDGGNVAQTLLLMRLPRTRALEISWASSFLVALVVGIVALWQRWFFVTLICLFAGQLAWARMGGAGPLQRLGRNLFGRR